ncbi:tetratricopeptide repeat protein [Dysgonomonas sp. BGC7]|uniref:tetratricopeptide repeat protein n=1 Tax=Dysgonomonas sp. BGC7 TaxID=1658008 RepID=UPI0006826D7C|nr:tetratricopeptide repeat protein [Dysgonomonas sp. BGC7]MBD8389473.1 tetratricopeptide repeat protein [Dysgonomonas sp. BGC7]
MKRFVLFTFFILFCFAVVNAQDSIPQSNVNDSIKAIVDKHNTEGEMTGVNGLATTAYNEGKFHEAIAILEKTGKEELAKGNESADLYYNLGNAYFRINDLANARLNYERALLLAPGDKDIKHNIDYLLTKVEDKILVADTFFLNIWFRVVQNILSSDGWAVLAIASFLVFIAGLVFFFFSKSIVVKKGAFYVGLVSLVIVIFANIFVFKQKNKIEHRDTAVIMVGSVPALSSPDINSKELFILHSGTKVSVTKEDRNWFEIEIDNGSVGWISRDKLEII